MRSRMVLVVGVSVCWKYRTVSSNYKSIKYELDEPSDKDISSKREIPENLN